MSVGAQIKEVDFLAGSGNLVFTYNAVAVLYHTISGFKWSYSSAPAAGDYIKIESYDGTTLTILDQTYITSAGPGFMPYPKGLPAPRGLAMIVTLVNSGSANVTLSVLNHVGPHN